MTGRRSRQWPWFALATSAAVLCFAAFTRGNDLLDYQREALARSELWRLWTAHTIHYGAFHTLWNLVVFAPASIWLERLAPARFRWFLFFAPLVSSVVLFVTERSLERYAGLSGLATGALTLLALKKLSDERSDRFLWRALLVLIVAKIVIEMVGGEPWFVMYDRPDIQVVGTVHVTGAATALLVHVASQLLARKAKKPPKRSRAHSGTL